MAEFANLPNHPATPPPSPPLLALLALLPGRTLENSSVGRMEGSHPPLSIGQRDSSTTNESTSQLPQSHFGSQHRCGRAAEITASARMRRRRVGVHSWSATTSTLSHSSRKQVTRRSTNGDLSDGAPTFHVKARIGARAGIGQSAVGSYNQTGRRNRTTKQFVCSQLLVWDVEWPKRETIRA